jgi:hypothetical protein
MVFLPSPLPGQISYYYFKSQPSIDSLKKMFVTATLGQFLLEQPIHSSFRSENLNSDFVTITLATPNISLPWNKKLSIECVNEAPTVK